MAGGASVLAITAAGCAELGFGSELSSADQTALETYTTSYETMQEAKDRYDDGIEIFRENLTADGTIEGEYPHDWPDLQETMLTSNSLFGDASDGFNQARRSASSSLIESACEDAVAWIEPHTEVARFFGDLGGPTASFIDEHEQQLDELPDPMSPTDLENGVTT
ncbi:hypothetical protein [Natranaeroarchaeum aerophilus]|uniref:Uncharacterized protein n=1 Tax=Natranaeroarchaeum aerophilus TaxID=2917711 RepID=A0AAE3FUN1_9EURY|nr:hypothetical protein [Natranaeroarchaeum aerophilus]MCL9815270.1 hypothetical protein [Natranaeroarchaeum aerophilus]